MLKARIPVGVVLTAAIAGSSVPWASTVTKPVTFRIRLCEAPAPRVLQGEDARVSWSKCEQPVPSVPFEVVAGELRTAFVQTGADGIVTIGPVEGADVEKFEIRAKCTTHACMTLSLDGNRISAGETAILVFSPRRPSLEEVEAVQAKALVPRVATKEVAALDEIPGIDTIVQLQFESAPLAIVVSTVGRFVPFAAEFEEGVGQIYVSAELEPQSARQALAYLADVYELAYEVSDAGHLVVRKRAVE